MLLVVVSNEVRGHMLGTYGILTVLFVMLLGLPSTAMASCPQHRLAGEWRAYFLPTAGSWVACDLKFGRDGSVKVGSTCRGSRMAKASASGRLSISSCVITGNIAVQNRRYVVKDASFNVDQSQIIGVLDLSNGRVVQFTSVRQ